MSERIKLKCIKPDCGTEFSKYGNNPREVCYKCKPKCNEIHYFPKQVKKAIIAKVETV